MKLLNYAVLIAVLFSGIALQGMWSLVGPDRDRVFLRKPSDLPFWLGLPDSLLRYSESLTGKAVPGMTQDQVVAMKDLDNLLFQARNGVIKRWQILLMNEAFTRVRKGTASDDDYRYAVLLPKHLPLYVSDVEAYVKAVYEPVLDHQGWQQWKFEKDMIKSSRLVAQLVDVQEVDAVTITFWKRLNHLAELSLVEVQRL